jgi:hypothetical protein
LVHGESDDVSTQALANISQDREAEHRESGTERRNSEETQRTDGGVGTERLPEQTKSIPEDTRHTNERGKLGNM